MGQKQKKVLSIVISVVFVLLIGLYLGRKEVAKACYGDLESFYYFTGLTHDLKNGLFEFYKITRDDDIYVLTAQVSGADSFNVECPIDASVTERIRDIITEESLFLLNGVEDGDYKLFDATSEQLEATFAGGTLTYNYFGYTTHRNPALADYLLGLAKDCYGIYGSPILETSSETEPSRTEETTIAATTATTAEETQPSETIVDPVDYVIRPEFDEAMPFNPYGYAVVGILTDGVMLSKPVYDAVRVTDAGEYIDVLRDGLWALVNANGAEVLAPVSTTPVITSNTMEMFGNWGLPRLNRAPVR